MRCWPRSPRSGSTRPSRRSGRTSASSRASSPLDSPPGLPRRAAPLSARGPGLARLPPAVRLRRHPGRRHGPGQDDPGAGAACSGGGRHRQAKGPSLAVVPRSLVFNWMQEAAKFTPRLRVLDYTGPGRHALRESFADYDLIVTTYGTVRTDIAELTPLRVRLRHPRRGPGDQERREPVGQGGPAACAAGTGWRSAARRSRTTSASSGRSSSS